MDYPDLTFNEETREWIDKNGARYSEDWKTLIKVPKDFEGVFSVPEFVKRIGDEAFYGCLGLCVIIIQGKVTSIGGYAFACCSNLYEIVIPESVKSIGYHAFSGCSSLNVLDIPYSVTRIGDKAFSGCSSLCVITIQGKVTSIGEYAFACCSSLKEIVIPESVKSIGVHAFFGCSNLREIVIPYSVTRIGDKAFSGCSSLNNIVLPKSVTSIGNHAFYGCYNLRHIKIPDSIEQIGEDAFFGCPIKEVRLSHTTNYYPNSFDEVTKVVKAKVFISYSWDDEQHKDWVRKLAEDLQKNGVYVILDQWELNAGELIPHFIDKSVAEAERVILIMTPNYKKKSDDLVGGVGYEYSVIKNELFANLTSNKIIPLLRVGPKKNACPKGFENRYYLDFRENIPYGNSFGQLIREIFKADYL